MRCHQNFEYVLDWVRLGTLFMKQRKKMGRSCKSLLSPKEEQWTVISLFFWFPSREHLKDHQASTYASAERVSRWWHFHPDEFWRTWTQFGDPREDDPFGHMISATTEWQIVPPKKSTRLEYSWRVLHVCINISTTSNNIIICETISWKFQPKKPDFWERLNPFSGDGWGYK